MTVRLTPRTATGETTRVESKIADTVRIKTSDDEQYERRYKVWLTLRYGDADRRVHVTLNDRSHMTHPLLVGRNFLKGHFVVDVALEETEAPSSPGAEAARAAVRD